MKYNTVYIGYPIWWGIAAWPVNNFVKGNDFTGKTVIPFCTSASSGIGDSGTLLAEMAGTGDWQDGQRFSSGASVSDVEDWVASLTVGNTVTMFMGLSVVLTGILLVLVKPVVAAMSTPTEAVSETVMYLRSYIVDCPIAGIHFCFSGYFCAYGLSGISFLHNVLSIVFVRIPGAYLTSMYFPDTLYPMGFAAPCGSVLSVMRVHYSIARIRRSQRKSGDKRLFADLTKELD